MLRSVSQSLPVKTGKSVFFLTYWWRGRLTGFYIPNTFTKFKPGTANEVMLVSNTHCVIYWVKRQKSYQE